MRGTGPRMRRAHAPKEATSAPCPIGDVDKFRDPSACCRSSRGGAVAHPAKGAIGGGTGIHSVRLVWCCMIVGEGHDRSAAPDALEVHLWPQSCHGAAGDGALGQSRCRQTFHKGSTQKALPHICMMCPRRRRIGVESDMVMVGLRGTRRHGARQLDLADGGVQGDECDHRVDWWSRSAWMEMGAHPEQRLVPALRSLQPLPNPRPSHRLSNCDCAPPGAIVACGENCLEA